MEGCFHIQGIPGTMQKITSTDAEQGLAASLVTRSDRQPAIAVAITVENNDLRICYDGTIPLTSNAGALGHILSAGQSVRLENSAAIGAFLFCSKTVGNAAILHITPEYSTSLTNSF